jgi:endonuclease/exonuclease/phosphatase family metal-dependent hydrolase
MSDFESKYFPARVSVTTFNVWGDELWPERSNQMSQCLQTLKSDVYLLQEVTPAIIEFLDNSLISYKRVTPSSTSESSLSWTTESNIYWNDNLFTLVDYGCSGLDIIDYPRRSLFWVRLSLRAQPYLTLFVSTAHLPWPGCPTELRTGMNQRIPAVLKACENFRKLLAPDEPVIFAGDFNEDFHPLRILEDELGFQEVFEMLDQPPPATHPVRPSSYTEERKPDRTIDWILCSLPPDCRVVAASVKELRGGAMPPVSDHKPVTAIFEIL